MRFYVKYYHRAQNNMQSQTAKSLVKYSEFNFRAHKSIWQILSKLKGEIKGNIVRVVNIITSLSTMSETSR